MSKFLLCFSALLSLFLTACEATLMRSLAAPQLLKPVQVQKNLVYDAKLGLALDLYRPHAPNNAPLLVFFHGGSWRNGDKSWYSFVGKHYALKGYLVAIPNYRKAQQAPFPAFMQDAAAAFAFARKHAKAWGGDAQQSYVLGTPPARISAAFWFLIHSIWRSARLAKLMLRAL
ncbi:alpha/beta hydrolase [bacterium]|nr:alpha/beta hydrolase [bacterium]